MTTPQLWTAHLTTLKGFYASDAYLIASTQEEAVEKVMEGVRAHVAEQVKDYMMLFAINCDPDDEEWDERIAAFYADVKREAEEKLTAVPSGVHVNVKT